VECESVIGGQRYGVGFGIDLVECYVVGTNAEDTMGQRPVA